MLYKYHLSQAKIIATSHAESFCSSTTKPKYGV
jgi:hypothetical protein